MQIMKVSAGVVQLPLILMTISVSVYAGHGDTGTNLGGGGGEGNSNGLLELRAEYGAVGADEPSDERWLDLWGYDLNEYRCPESCPESWNKDLIALREALRDASEGGDEVGKAVFIEPGSYYPMRSGMPWTVPIDSRGVEIRGASVAAVILNMNGGFAIGAYEDVTLEEFTIVGGGVRAEGAARLNLRSVKSEMAGGSAAFELIDCDKVWLNDCAAVGAGGAGFLARSASNGASTRLFLRSCEATGCGTAGFQLNPGTATVMFSECHALKNGVHGFLLAGVASVIVKNIVMTDCMSGLHRATSDASGVWMSNVRNVQVYGGAFYSNKGSGVRVTCGEQRCENVRIGMADIGVLQNEDAGNDMAGVWLQGAASSSVVDCQVRFNPVGVLITRGTDDGDYNAGIVIGGSTITDNDDVGVEVRGGVHAVNVSDCTVAFNGLYSSCEARGGVALLGTEQVLSSQILRNNQFQANGNNPWRHIHTTGNVCSMMALGNSYIAVGPPYGPVLPALPNLIADYDGNDLVNLCDHAAFVSCVSGPGNDARSECGVFDVNDDGDVDRADWQVLQSLFNGQ
jgi:Right handed beta helix region